MTGDTPRWKLWGTVLWSAVVIAVFVGSQMAFATAYLAATMGRLTPERAAEELRKLGSNGDVVAVATFLSTPACLLAIFVIVKLKRGATLEDSLALRVPEPRVLVRWLLILVAFAALSDGLTWLLGKPIVPEFMERVYRSADNKGALWIALVVAAPVFEEVFFRGFMITGLSSSRLGASGAVLLSALVWASIHGQYDGYGIVTIFALGVLLGAARVKTRSVATPLAMHMAANLIATLEVALL
jgi:membrane protease YdiL (CAAX protease family)